MIKRAEEFRVHTLPDVHSGDLDREIHPRSDAQIVTACALANYMYVRT